MIDRRDLLKKFGIGALIAPIVGGAVEQSAVAELVEVPKIRPVELFSKIPETLDLSKVRSAKLVMQMADGSIRSISADVVVGRGAVGPADQIRLSAELLRCERGVSPAVEFPLGRLWGSASLA